MTHSEARSEWYREGLIALGTGVLYGATNAVVGHPMDTVKAKMQAQSGFADGGRQTMMSVIKRIWATEGTVGFFRGVVPPLCGSSIYRSTQFAVFESVFTLCEQNGWNKDVIPLTGGLAWATLFSGACGASARAVIEQPIEYAKVKRQTNQTWYVREAYQGFFVQLPRTVGMMSFIFCGVDSVRRWSNGKALQHPVTQFLTWGGISMCGFWVIWPLETIKNQVQAGLVIDGTDKPTLAQRIRYLGGPIGLYRGILPGSISVLLRNGTAAVVMGYANRKITELGLRGPPKK